MRRALSIALTCLPLLGLTDCSRAKHPQDQQAQQQNAPAGSTSPAPAPAAPSSGGGVFSSCPQAPLKSQLEATIKSAMSQIYGPDEAGAKIAVTAMNPGADCKTFTVGYKASGSSANAPLIYGDDGKWSVVLYKKSYPVQ